MKKIQQDRMLVRGFRLVLPLCVGITLIVAALFAMRSDVKLIHADPIPPPDGYPKLLLSLKTVTPTLAHTGGSTLTYLIEIRNTGAYTASGAMVSDTIPVGTTYNNDAAASSGPAPVLSGGALQWNGDVGFDASEWISFSVTVAPSFSGTVLNSAVISHSLLAAPIFVSAESTITDMPLLVLEKGSEPAIPGPGNAMTYTIIVTNLGQLAANVPITVTDEIPTDTSFRTVGPDGSYIPALNEVTWTRNVTLALGQTTVFSFSVDVGVVPSGTIISNDSYQVASKLGGISAGSVHTVTVLNPIFDLSKETIPDPPGSNREVTYLLTLLNTGSLASNVVITDAVPAGTTYVDGGSESGGVVTWHWPRLDTMESAIFTFTVYISDVADISLINSDFGVCSALSVCQPGKTLTSVVGPPHFEAFAFVDPIAHKPGGGTGTEVTPTLVVRNIGPGNALDATALLYFRRLSVSANDLVIIDDSGIPSPAPLPDGPVCGDKCVSYMWQGDLAIGETITFSTGTGQSTIGGAEGTHYTSTIVISDALSNMNTDPVTATVAGLVTHKANLLPTKAAPTVIGPGQSMVYSFHVQNSGLSTDEPPPWLTDTVPMSVTVVSISDGGVSMTVGSSVVVSWSLPALSTGEELWRSYQVRVDPDLVSGTQIINDDYMAQWYESEDKAWLSSGGPSVTTTVKEVGLIDSFKMVTPTLALPGAQNTLTYFVHVVNSSALSLTGVSVYDWLPWQWSTYQRDAAASAGSVISDIVSIQWTGDVKAFSEEVITFTVAVDPYFKGLITNTAVISHPALIDVITVTATAVVTDEPLLSISKSASPDPVSNGKELAYTIEVVNRGQDAFHVIVTDTIPTYTSYVADSATAGGKLRSGRIEWELPVLEAGSTRVLSFRVLVTGGTSEIVNDRYGVRADGGASASGAPVITRVKAGNVYLPIVLRN